MGNEYRRSTARVRTLTRDQRLLEAAVLAAVCLLPILLYLPALDAPFERDEGVYATMARGLLDGQVPYRDLFDNKPPLIYAWYAVSFLAFGESVSAPRFLASVLLSLTTLSLFGQARLMFSKEVAFLIAAIFALSTGLALVAVNANSEAYMLLPLVTSLFCFTLGMRSGRARWFFLAGALNGLAIMTKQVALWNLLALAGVLTVSQWRSLGLTLRTPRPLARAAAPTLALISGSALAVAAVAAPFAATNALDDLVYANVSYNWLWVSLVSYSEQFLNFLAGTLFFSVVATPLLAGLVLGVAVLWSRRKWPWDYLLLLWTAASVIGVASGGRYFPHYFMQLLPAIAILTGLVLYERVLKSRTTLPRPALLAGAGFLAVALITNALLHFWPMEVKARFSPTIHEQAQWERVSRDLAEYVAARTDPDDPIYVLGRESQIYFYADRRPAARYFYERPFWLDETSLRQTIEALEEARPVYLIDAAQPPLFEDYWDYHPPQLTAFIAENYEYAGRIYFADLYRLKEDPSP